MGSVQAAPSLLRLEATAVQEASCVYDKPDPTLLCGMPSRSVIEQVSLELLSALFPLSKGVRLLGVTLSSLNTEAEPRDPQLALTL